MRKKLLSFAIALSLGMSTAAACTTTIVTPGASADGSMLITHSNDDGLCDPSIVYVPAKDHPAGSRRPVYPSAIANDELPANNCYMTPRLVDPDRAPGYAYANEKATIPLGWIPEAAHTYAYMDSDYGIMNEHGLMLGECTDASRLRNMPASEGSGLFYASELGRVALERCRTAREAVDLMGRLVDTYGLYGSGETLLVADRQEAYVFEFQPATGPVRGIWIAQRVPDGEFFAAANQFRIQDITEGRSDLIFNPELPAQLKALGWAATDPDTGNLDWQRSVKGEESYHPYHDLRRVWRAMSLAAPSLQLPSRVEGPYTRAYPFAVKPDHPLTLEDLMKMHRDVYEGTEFDMTKTSNSGLFGSPYRYGDGHTQRPIASMITGYTWITQNNAALPSPIAWVSLASPRENPFVPLAVAPMPQGYEQVDRRHYDTSKPWWHSMQTSELLQGRDSVYRQETQAALQTVEKKSIQLVETSKGKSPADFADILRKNALTVDRDWQAFYGEMLVNHNQGKNSPMNPPNVLSFEDVDNY